MPPQSSRRKLWSLSNSGTASAFISSRPPVPASRQIHTTKMFSNPYRLKSIYLHTGFGGQSGAPILLVGTRKDKVVLAANALHVATVFSIVPLIF